MILLGVLTALPTPPGSQVSTLTSTLFMGLEAGAELAVFDVLTRPCVGMIERVGITNVAFCRTEAPETPVTVTAIFSAAKFSFSFVMKPFGEGSLRNAVSDLVFVPVIGSESKTLNLTLSDSFPLRRQCLLSGCRHAKEVIGTYVTGTAILVATVFEN